ARSLSLTEIVERVISESQLLSSISKQPDHLERIEIVKAFIEQVRRFSLEQPNAELSDFLTYIGLLRSYNVRLPVNRVMPLETGVFVATVHGAKGLEFDTV